MREVAVKLFKISELKGKARDRAIARVHEGVMAADYINDELEEQFKEVLKEFGLPTSKLAYRLSYSQGDGVAFYGKCDIKKLLKYFPSQIRDLAIADGWEIEIEKVGPHLYDHENTMKVVIVISGSYLSDDDEKAVHAAEHAILEQVRSYSADLCKMGYLLIEKRTSEEALIDHAEANEMEFTEDGRLF